MSTKPSGAAALAVMGLALGFGLVAGLSVWRGGRRPAPVASHPTRS